ncbi:DNA primase [Kineococcus indalonis]|uniref:DNA primase n=1 Tax=Kineococcus indalonis TaxID=2696566 RepID=UPI0014124711|nr:DNA primase [Kineococcus indalonis]NAZ86699.1 DNA primase [Kineococcus indalonis]
MPGLIHPDDLRAVKERVRIDEVVAEQVTLRPGGVGSFKGLCPFHDERTPSFTVRPAVGRWHCFGCGEGGDAIEFVMRIDGTSFAEAVERLAERAGVQLRHVDDGGRPGRRPAGAGAAGQRQRLLEAHRLAEAFYAEQLEQPGPAEAARRFLAERGFSREAAARFGVGFAPAGGEALLRHLRAKGVTEEELTTSGLAGQGARGLYDRFRGRLVWPIRDVSGHTVAFGARRLFDDDRVEAKYLNSPETPLYKKSQALYGLDLAKRDIARTKQVVVVEGYTDVMACHLAGVTTAVATCGTAFGEEHARVVQRMLGDARGAAEVVFTFDGDAAGQKAALRAFELDQRFTAQTYVAVEPSGQDPCDLRLSAGDAAVAALVAGRVPLFEFAIRSTISRYDLGSDPGRLAALDAAAPIVASIRDSGLRQRYAVNLDRWTGFLDERFVLDRVRRHAGDQPGAPERSAAPARRGAPGGPGPAAPPSPSSPSSSGPPVPSSSPAGDAVVQLERWVLACVLQAPWVAAEEFTELAGDAFGLPLHRAVHDAVTAAGGPLEAPQGPGWVEAVLGYADGPVAALVQELAVTDLPVRDEEELERWGRSLVATLAGQAATRAVADVKRRLWSIDAGARPEEYRAASAELFRLEAARRAWQERVQGV